MRLKQWTDDQSSLNKQRVFRLTRLAAWSAFLTMAASTASGLAKSHEWCPPFGLERVGAPGGTNEFEADAVAVAEPRTNPVDLGAILVPDGWLLLGRGEKADIEAAALSRSHDLPDARLRSWFSSEPGKAVSIPFPLPRNERCQRKVRLPSAP